MFPNAENVSNVEISALHLRYQEKTGKLIWIEKIFSVPQIAGRAPGGKKQNLDKSRVHADYVSGYAPGHKSI